jgi:hypothetical protein
MLVKPGMRLTRRGHSCLVVLACAFSGAVLSGCDQKPTAPTHNVIVSRHCGAEKLRRAIDRYRVAPNPETSAGVARELRDLNACITDLEDKAHVAAAGVQAQLLLDAEALRSARDFDLQRFHAPFESPPVVVAAPAKKVEPVAESKPAVKRAIAMAPKTEPQVPVRRAVAVAAGEPVIAQAAAATGEVPVRRAIAIGPAARVDNARIVQSGSGRRLTIWARPERFPRFSQR